MFSVLLNDTHIVILLKICVFNFLTLSCAAVGQDVDDGLLVSPCRENTMHKQMQLSDKQKM